MLKRLSSKAKTAGELLANPHLLRVYVCNRFPRLSPGSRFIWWLYPAWRKYQLYRWTFRFAGEQKESAPPNRRRYLMRVQNNAGIGDQIVTAWSETFMLARKHALSFVHHPFQRSSHCPDVDWESFLGFAKGEVTSNEVLSHLRLKRVCLPPIQLNSPENHRVMSRLINRVYSGNNLLFDLGIGVYLNCDIEQAEVMPSVYREKYWAARTAMPMQASFDERALNVAVHIRRGDLALYRDDPAVRWERRWIGLPYYRTLLEELLDAIPGPTLRIHVYSDGNADDLSALTELPNTTFHLGEDPRQSFHDMIVADVLVVSTSAFALCAGKISEGIKLAGRHFDTPDFRLFIPTTDDWIQVETDGHFLPGTKSLLTRALRGENSGTSMRGMSDAP